MIYRHRILKNTVMSLCEIIYVENNEKVRSFAFQLCAYQRQVVFDEIELLRN